MDFSNDSDVEPKIQLDPAVKKQLVQYGVLTLVLFLLFVLLLSSVLMSRRSWEKGLRTQVVSALEQQGDYIVGDYETVSSPFSVSCASYGLSKKDENSSTDLSSYHAVIIRVQTIFGPVPAVYTYKDGSDEAEFVCFVTLNNRIASTVENNARYSQIAYWAKRIPVILAKKDS